jgi:hypothetical protein
MMPQTLPLGYDWDSCLWGETLPLSIGKISRLEKGFSSGSLSTIPFLQAKGRVHIQSMD